MVDAASSHKAFSADFPVNQITADERTSLITRQEIWARLVDRAAELRQAGLRNNSQRWEYAVTELENMANWLTSEMSKPSKSTKITYNSE